MRVWLKRMGYSVIALLGLLFIFIAISFTNHRIQSKQESALLVPPGTMVNVNNHEMHVYTEGTGSRTLVFMSGGGTSAPVLDFKALYTRLSDQYKIAVVEKAGYGFSETAKVSRDIDTMLEETRTALTLAGQQPPYVLFPHSMSGIEASYWAQMYPDEVEAIIGLDPAVPEVYEEYPLPSPGTMTLTGMGARIGITRFFPGIVDSSAAIQQKQLSSQEEELYRALFYKSTQTSNMNDEVKMIRDNAAKVLEHGVPDVPMYFFGSSGEEVPVKNWQAVLKNYIASVKKGEILILPGGHYIHNEAPDRIAEESKRFIEQL
ncbi:pimeloyl-ACP methyl ester carboxylesterase [Paenibacillus amylolyticus]|uniref:Pimeloyl-ACP methyl ester carboxylesterase n=1 Tax=Paenibacillus amylolyticus TaxID=1451 RepID=A0AAP5LR86_PAEAM|nr:alpha/beta hydrolase [Paenibacillus amylolyticus]MDR6726440.1 pimeloyl-ACP methyl ester carboxylesterase [Paenibacillus amylolyticus]